MQSQTVSVSPTIVDGDVLISWEVETWKKLPKFATVISHLIIFSEIRGLGDTLGTCTSKADETICLVYTYVCKLGCDTENKIFHYMNRIFANAE